MKVLHLISGGDTGGAKTHIISLMKGLQNIIDVKIICFIKDTFYEEVKDSNIDIEVFEQKGRLDMSVISRLEEEINNKNYDIIHCHGARANFVAMFLKSRVRKPFITTIHSDYELDFKDNFYKKLIFTNLNKVALNRFDYYIAISDSFKDMLVERGFKSDKIFTAYNGIDLESEMNYVSKDDFVSRYNIDAGNKTIIGIIARLDAVKDHETFIRAADVVLKERDDVLFLIAGDGNDKKRLSSIVEELGIGEYVHFVGYVKDPYSFFNAIDINILTSISESFPYVILEGARMKKPIISTKVGGVSMLVKDDYNGYTIDVGDYKALADKVNYLLSNPEKHKIMGENLYNNVKDNFSSEPMARRHVEIYNEILNSVEVK
ncbi:MAG: glycosyltransferase family 4 protein [Tissierellaceae bacterium]|nr:glycosyltransferase family 4 protein [Tissierellaceae bacterium]